MTSTSELRQKRKDRQRTKLKRISPDKLRLTVHRTNKHMYAQIIDDTKSATLVSSSTLSGAAKDLKSGSNKEAASLVGNLIAEQALKKGITEVAFDRSGFLYHGRIQVLAEAAREHGLKF